MKKLLSRSGFVRYFYPLFRRLESTLLAADTVMQQNRHYVSSVRLTRSSSFMCCRPVSMV